MKFSRVLAAAAAAALLFAGQAQAETVLRYSNWLPEKHRVFKNVLKPFIEQVEQASNGDIKIDTLPKVVGSVPGQYDVAVDGLADITFLVLGYTPGRFPLSEIAELPFVGDNPEALSVAFWRIYEQDLEKYNEFKGTKVLTLAVSSPANFATREKPIEKLSDLKGLKMRNPTAGFVPAAEALGTIPVNKPISELYELASSGVVDGTFTPLDSMVSFNLTEVLPHVTKVKGGLLSASLAVVMNIDSWNGLSADQQKIIMDAAGESMARKIGAGYAKSDANAEAQMTAAEGQSVDEASPELMSELHDKLAFIEAGWVEKAKAAGAENGSEIVKKLKDIVDSYGK